MSFKIFHVYCKSLISPDNHKMLRRVAGQNTQIQYTQAQNTQTQITQSPKIPKIEITMSI